MVQFMDGLLHACEQTSA